MISMKMIVSLPTQPWPLTPTRHWSGSTMTMRRMMMKLTYPELRSVFQHSPDLFTPGPATAVQDIRPPSSYCWLDQGEPTEFGKRGLCCWAIHARFAKDKVNNNPKNTMERGKNSRKPKKKLVESSYYPYQAICRWLASVSFSLYLWFYLSYEINNSYNLPFYCFTSCLCIFSQS